MTDSILHNLDLNMGVGSTAFSGVLLGNNKITAGVGEVKLDLENKIEDYQMKISKGMGSIKVNQEEIKENTIYGTGENKIDIDGGVGSIKITSQK